MTQTQADHFATRWLDAWNAHDLDVILEHYAEQVRFTSLFAVRITGRSLIEEKENLRVYFSLALRRFPDLQFANCRAFAGETGLTLVYQSVQNLKAAETMLPDDNERIVQVRAHYRSAIG